MFTRIRSEMKQKESRSKKETRKIKKTAATLTLRLRRVHRQEKRQQEKDIVNEEKETVKRAAESE